MKSRCRDKMTVTALDAAHAGSTGVTAVPGLARSPAPASQNVPESEGPKRVVAPQPHPS